MNRDLRDPKLLGEKLLSVPVPLRQAADLNPSVDDYSANPTCIEKYGRPQDLPPTPF